MMKHGELARKRERKALKRKKIIKGRLTAHGSKSLPASVKNLTTYQEAKNEHLVQKPEVKKIKESSLRSERKHGFLRKIFGRRRGV